jgi:hypothetical protein
MHKTASPSYVGRWFGHDLSLRKLPFTKTDTFFGAPRV